MQKQPALPLQGPARPSLKRVLDILGAALLLLFLAPALGLAALLILAETGGPVLTTRRRIGPGGISLNLFEFRTTTADGGITRIAGVLHATRMDGLPRLLNVLRGEMSLADFTL
jgi:lipopolysaccharide/colanic/teichoic acid biosynthesis glycosyltransferase